MPFERPYLTCQELVELVTAAHDGALKLGERVKYELHLAACNECRAYVSQFDGTTRALSKLKASDDSKARPAVSPELLAKFRARFPGPSSGPASGPSSEEK